MNAPRTALLAGEILTVTADASSSGFVKRSAASGSTTAYGATAISASGSLVIGPFNTDRQYEIVSLAGLLNYTIARSEPAGEDIFGAVPTVAAAVNGAISIAPGTVVFTKAGVAAMTLAAPTARQEGIVMTFVAGTANAHTLTATGLLDDGVTGGSKTTATFAAFVGASLTLMAYNLKWVVLANNNVAISA